MRRRSYTGGPGDAEVDWNAVVHVHVHVHVDVDVHVHLGPTPPSV